MFSFGQYKLSEFDEITKFRLVNVFLFLVGFNMFIPVLLQLKGIYMLTWVIAVFLILEQLALKTNKYITERYSLSNLYQLGIYLHIAFICIACSYYINPAFMVYGDTIFGILEMAIFSAYTIKLTNHIAENYPEQMNNFQIKRNSIGADATILGLALAASISYFFSDAYTIGTFILWNSVYTLWMIKNWSFYKK